MIVCTRNNLYIWFCIVNIINVIFLFMISKFYLCKLDNIITLFSFSGTKRNVLLYCEDARFFSILWPGEERKNVEKNKVSWQKEDGRGMGEVERGREKSKQTLCVEAS